MNYQAFTNESLMMYNGRAEIAECIISRQRATHAIVHHRQAVVRERLIVHPVLTL